MNSWVCCITNNINWDRLASRINWDWIFEIEKGVFKMEWTFKLNESLEELVWIISFEVNDIVYWNNQDILLFSYDFSYKSLSESKKGIPNIKRWIWYLKLKTWLTEEEEKFLRNYNRMSIDSKNALLRRYKELQSKIQKNITEERERIMHILNDEKWHGGWIDLF